MKEFTDWLENDAEDCGLCSPPMDSQLAVNFLQKYLLGDNWYCTGISATTVQCNTEVVFAILNKHSRRFRKEWKKYRKKEMANFLMNFVTEALTNPKCIVVENWLESEVQEDEI